MAFLERTQRAHVIPITDRHMARHKEKDDEAGGEGLGRLQTRKRLWRDSTGAVVTKRRPEHEKRSVSSSPTSKRLKVRDHSSDSTNAFLAQKEVPKSPPHSTSEYQSYRLDGTRPSEATGEPRQTTESWPAFSEASTLPEDDAAAAESFEFLYNASWGSHPQKSSTTDVLYNGGSGPDSGP